METFIVEVQVDVLDGTLSKKMTINNISVAEWHAFQDNRHVEAKMFSCERYPYR